MNTKDRSFGETIRILRTERGVGLREFARRINVAPTYLSNIELGMSHPPSEEIVKRIAQELDVPSDALLAVAGKIDPDLVKVILEHNTVLPDLIRILDGQSQDVVRECRLLVDNHILKLRTDQMIRAPYMDSDLEAVLPINDSSSSKVVVDDVHEQERQLNEHGKK